MNFIIPIINCGTLNECNIASFKNFPIGAAINHFNVFVYFECVCRIKIEMKRISQSCEVRSVRRGLFICD